MTKTADERALDIYEMWDVEEPEIGLIVTELKEHGKQESEAALREAVGRLEEMAHTEPQIIYDGVRFISLPEAKRALLDEGAE